MHLAVNEFILLLYESLELFTGCCLVTVVKRNILHNSSTVLLVPIEGLSTYSSNMLSNRSIDQYESALKIIFKTV